MRSHENNVTIGVNAENEPNTVKIIMLNLLTTLILDHLNMLRFFDFRKSKRDQSLCGGVFVVFSTL